MQVILLFGPSGKHGLHHVIISPGFWFLNCCVRPGSVLLYQFTQGFGIHTQSIFPSHQAVSLNRVCWSFFCPCSTGASLAHAACHHRPQGHLRLRRAPCKYKYCIYKYYISSCTHSHSSWCRWSGTSAWPGRLVSLLGLRCGSTRWLLFLRCKEGVTATIGNGNYFMSTLKVLR